MPPGEVFCSFSWSVLPVSLCPCCLSEGVVVVPELLFSGPRVVVFCVNGLWKIVSSVALPYFAANGRACGCPLVQELVACRRSFLCFLSPSLIVACRLLFLPGVLPFYTPLLVAKKFLCASLSSPPVLLFSGVDPRFAARPRFVVPLFGPLEV